MKLKAALLSVGICLASMLVSAQTYTITDLGTLPAPYNQISQASGINNSGQVIGTSLEATGGNVHAFLYNNGNMLDLGTLPNDNDSVATAVNAGGEATGYSDTQSSPGDAFLYSAGGLASLGTLGGPGSYGFAINDTGEVVGISETAAEVNHAFLYNGTMNDLGTLPGGTYSYAYGINGSGQVVGTSSIGSGEPEYAFLYNNGVMQNLGTVPGGSGSVAMAINATGQIIGAAYLSDNTVAFLYSDGVMQDLGILPGFAQSYATAINSQSQIVGSSCNVNETSSCHPFLYSGGNLTDLNTLLPPGSDWTLSGAYGINDSGQIVGGGTNPQGERHAFLMTPVTGNWSDQNLITLSGSGTLAEAKAGLGGYAIQDGQHIFFVANNQHVHQLYFNNSSWADQDITGYNGNQELAATNSAVSAFADARGQYTYFVDTKQHIREYLYDSNGIWHDTDLSAGTGIVAQSGTGLASYAIADGVHVFYIGSDKHVFQLYYSAAQGTWSNQDLTSFNGNKELAASPSALSSFADANGQHTYFVDTKRDVHEYLYSAGQWSDSNLMTLANSKTQAAVRSGLSSYAIPDGRHIYFEASNDHVHQLYFNNSTWSDQDLTRFNGDHETASPGAIRSFALGDGQHTYFVDGKHNLREYLYNSAGQWEDYNLTSLSNSGTSAEAGSAVSAFSISDGQHVIYVSTSLDVHQILN
jgi:probable HAF family extracellular repeat protein